MVTQEPSIFLAHKPNFLPSVRQSRRSIPEAQLKYLLTPSSLALLETSSKAPHEAETAQEAGSQSALFRCHVDIRFLLNSGVIMSTYYVLDLGAHTVCP